jgi:hypothetical protein
MRFRAQTLLAAAIVATTVGLGGASAASPDPLVGTWTRSGTTNRTDVTQTAPGSFVGKRLWSGTIGPCSWPVGHVQWELSKRPDGTYAGTGHGFRWESDDPATCKDLPISTTVKLGTISSGRLSMSLCYAATQWTAAECRTYTRPATEPPAKLVPIESVSNGCGGGDWRLIVKVQNFLGNTSTYWNSRDSLVYDPLAKSHTVDFVDACNLHDAGYAGAIVRDKLRGGIKDFRSWTRKQVDKKFLADMRFLCQRQIPDEAPYALKNCRGRGGNASWGAESRYRFVRKHGYRFFDADLDEPGTQRTGSRANN